uniref:Uncharacterized protein n=2 Tax=Oncorhynchus mykiss TaxID=8022 RepID=A0A8K9UWC1_ONCMY
MSSLSYFTPAREEELLWSGNAGAATGPQPSTLGGEEARRFYQSLIEEGDGEERRGMEQRGRENRRGRRAGQHVQASRQQANTTSTTTELEGLRLLRCAQEGDLSGVRGLLSRGVDVNFQDSWWWTGVMCAAAAGQRGVVRLLLQQGAAWVGVVDTQGRDARELARMAGHSGVLEELDHYGSPQDCDRPGRQRGQHNHYRRETQDHQDHRLVTDWETEGSTQPLQERDAGPPGPQVSDLTGRQRGQHNHYRRETQDHQDHRLVTDWETEGSTQPLQERDAGPPGPQVSDLTGRQRGQHNHYRRETQDHQDHRLVTDWETEGSTQSLQERDAGPPGPQVSD